MAGEVETVEVATVEAESAQVEQNHTTEQEELVQFLKFCINLNSHIVN